MWTACRIWIDNTAGEAALGKGAAKADDHNMLSHALWLHAAKEHIGIQFERVESKQNISDDPSRLDWTIMEALEAKWVAPVQPTILWQPKDWVKGRYD